MFCAVVGNVVDGMLNEGIEVPPDVAPSLGIEEEPADGKLIVPRPIGGLELNDGNPELLDDAGNVLCDLVRFGAVELKLNEGIEGPMGPAGNVGAPVVNEGAPGRRV